MPAARRRLSPPFCGRRAVSCGRAPSIGFEFVTESEYIAEFVISLLEDVFGAELKVVQATADARNGRNRLVFQCLSSRSLFILSELGILSSDGGGDHAQPRDRPLPSSKNECCRRAYVLGAFLGSGSCTIPKLEDARSGYHLEIVFSGKAMADDFCEILAEFEVLAKCVERKGFPASFTSKAGKASAIFSPFSGRKRRSKSSTNSPRKRM